MAADGGGRHGIIMGFFLLKLCKVLQQVLANASLFCSVLANEKVFHKAL